MRFMIGFDVEIPDAVALQLLRSAGVSLPPEDYLLALALVAIQPFPTQMREFLLADDHTPIAPDTPTTITEPTSQIQIQLVLAPEGDMPWTTPQTPPASPQKRPSAPRPAAPGSGSPLTSTRRRKRKRS